MTQLEGLLDHRCWLTELTQVQINTLLDLRQKQASITQANDTAKQSNTIFVFTIITIVFVSNIYKALTLPGHFRITAYTYAAPSLIFIIVICVGRG